VNTGQIVEEVSYSQETVDALEKMAERLATCASNVRHNNYNLYPEWDGRAGGFEQAALYIRLDIAEHTAKDEA